MNPVVLVVLDGWGISRQVRGNAILNAKLPNYKHLLATKPNLELEASGIYVGLPPGLMGNSEVGHLTIGSGQSVIQKLTLISNTISNGTFYTNEVLLKACEQVNKKNSKLHLIGLLSDGCVHSSLDHLYGLIELSRRHNVKTIVIHPILDGRDTPPKSALRFIKDLEGKLQPNEHIGVLSGRFYAMDRDQRWERIEKYYNALVLGQGEYFELSTDAIKTNYTKDITDEFITPSVITNLPIEDGDSVICFNFRPDRVRQISHCLTIKNFNFFNRLKTPDIHYVCFTEYDNSLNLPIAFDAQTMQTEKIAITLPEILACNHIKQFHTAETEKYAHVTYFFNGGKEELLPDEDRFLIPSLKVTTYDNAPQMQTKAICKLVCDKLTENKYPFIVLNFANPDMVGHTGNLECAIEACESVDVALGALSEAIACANGSLVITADHGNCEQMIDLSTNEPHTAHTSNKVPFIVSSFNPNLEISVSNDHDKAISLANVAPSILTLMNIPIPKEMTTKSLIQVN